MPRIPPYVRLGVSVSWCLFVCCLGIVSAGFSVVLGVDDDAGLGVVLFEVRVALLAIVSLVFVLIF